MNDLWELIIYIVLILGGGCSTAGTWWWRNQKKKRAQTNRKAVNSKDNRTSAPSCFCPDGVLVNG